MEPTTRDAGSPLRESYVWEPPGNAVSIHISLNAIDGIAKEVLKAFSSVPKRGAEAGGLLLGSVERNRGLVVRIRSFEAVPCEHRFGPSYVLSESDKRAFATAYRKYAAPENGGDRVIGYFRSHTRDGLALGPEDLALCRDLFSDPSNVVLLIKPFATKVSIAGFLFYEDGKFQDEPCLTFPFRRKDLAAGTAAIEGDSAPLVELATVREKSEQRPERERNSAPAVAAVPVEIPEIRSPAATVEPRRGKPRVRWTWIPLSLGLLVIGALLGWQAARTMTPKVVSAPAPVNFSLGLAVTNTDENLRVTWDKQSPVIGAASGGLLEITDGDYQKAVSLDSAQLENGNVTYRHLTPAVVFRLTVFPAKKTRVEETFSWKAGP